MKFSQEGIEFLEEVESLELCEYPDACGYPTIGIGHLLTKSELSSGKIVVQDFLTNEIHIVKFHNGITEQQAFSLLYQDLKPVMETVSRHVRVILSQNQFDALVSFAFNIGDTAFLTSSLIKKLNLSQYHEVPFEMRRWNKGRVNGKLVVINGLVNRREKEILLWNNKWMK